MSGINPMGILHSFSIFARVFNFKSLNYSHAAQIKRKCVLGPVFSKKISHLKKFFEMFNI